MPVMSIAHIPTPELQGKRVLMRVDFNVPLKNGVIQNDQRIRAALPSIRYLLKQGAHVILMSHLGRPKGKVNEELRLAPVGQRLSKLLDRPVTILSDCVGPEIEASVDTAVTEAAAQNSTSLVLLENTRFYAEETDNEASFAEKLAQLGDIYVNDAFGTAHRAHASTAGVAAHLPAYAGLLMEKEIAALSGLLENPAFPFVAVIGGAKVSTKLAVLENLLSRVDSLVIGGAMAYTFLAAQGIDVGKSLTEPELFETALELLKQAETENTQILLPVDTVMASDINGPKADSVVRLAPDFHPEADLSGVDIGPESIAAIDKILRSAQTVLWNGPMGVFENPPFARGTEAVARILAQRSQQGCQTVVGGGDSVAAVEKLGLAEQFNHVSTGGGASLEFLEGKELPGIAVLKHN